MSQRTNQAVGFVTLVGHRLAPAGQRLLDQLTGLFAVGLTHLVGCTGGIDHGQAHRAPPGGDVADPHGHLGAMGWATYTAGMAGRIRHEDVALVRERAPIAEVVGDHVTLKSAGGGSLKGLCPFHEERSPSFHVTPAKGLYHCFGCQVGGDVIDFVVRIDHLTFQEAVEKLAARAGVQLRYEESGTAPRTSAGRANTVARGPSGRGVLLPGAARRA